MKKRFKAVEAEQFIDLRVAYRVTLENAAEMLHVSPRTVANWESGATRIPYSAFKLFRILTGYELPGTAWEGWCIRGDTLWSPVNRPFKAQELYYISHYFRMARNWQAHYERMAQLKQQAKVQQAPTHLGRKLRLVSVSGGD